MFCSRSLNNSLNHIHECALKLTYNDHAHYFQDVIEMTNEKTLHEENLKYLAKEIYKLLQGLYYYCIIFDVKINSVNEL